MANLQQIKTDSNWGAEAPRINENFNAVNSELSKLGATSGIAVPLFASVSEAQKYITNPYVGKLILVGSTLPAPVYRWNGSSWANTGTTGGNASAPLTDYYTKEEINAQQAENDTKFSELGQLINVDRLIPLGSGQYTIETAANALWDNRKDLCTKGAAITFKEGSNFNIYQFQNSDNIVNESVWKKKGSWQLLTMPRVFHVSPSEGIDRINNILWDNQDGCTIELDEGEYTGTAGINFTNGGSAVCSNCMIVGKGIKTIIKRSSLNNDLVATIGENNIIRNVQFAKSIVRKISTVKIYQCYVNGEYLDDSSKSCYDIKIAASDSSDLAKFGADIICGSTNADVAINTAINSLSNGGSIFLAAGTYILSSYINLKGKSNVSIKGCGKNTYLQRSGGDSMMDDDTTVDCCVSEVRMSNYSLSDKTYFFNVWKNDDYINQKTSYIIVKPSEGIAGINTAINTLVDGGRILLEEGEYTGTAGINFTKSNIIVEGKGAKTIINRDTKTNDVFSNSNVTGNIVRDLTIANNYQQNGDYPTQRYRIINCYCNGTVIDQSDTSNVIINVGNSYFYKSVITPYKIISANNWTYRTRFEIHVHGHIIEKEDIYWGKPVDLIGHNALIELQGSKKPYWLFANPSSEMSTDYKMIDKSNKVKDIHFIKTGCYAYRDAPCVTVTSPTTLFERCIFENATSSPVPFDNTDYGVGSESEYGCRRHGCVVSIDRFSESCNTRFIDCIAIGSPYGFQSCRGWYIAFGFPKLYNCIGIGGGIGEFGHGILNHRSSQAELFNCIGYAGNRTFRQGAGIRFQAHGSSNLNSCIGYGSNGEKYKSEGVSKERLLELCSELGIEDTSFFIDEDDVNYDGLVLTSEKYPTSTSDDGYDDSRRLLLSHLTNDDVRIVPLNKNTEEGYGISFWANSGMARLLNCKGYGGSGDNSHGLHIIKNAEPTIIGGEFGSQIIMDNKAWSGGKEMIFKPDNVNDFTKYRVKKVVVTILTVYNTDTKFYLESEDGSIKVVDGFQMQGISSIVVCDTISSSISAGVKLKAYIMQDSQNIDIAKDKMYIHLLYEYDSDNASALYIADKANPIITGAVIRSNGNSKAIESTVQNIKVFDCAVEGQVDSNVSFAAKNFINDSSNYSL